jgi:hypothetical protein
VAAACVCTERGDVVADNIRWLYFAMYSVSTWTQWSRPTLTTTAIFAVRSSG